VGNADKVTLFVTALADIPIIREAIQCYERASGAHLNTRKSKALPVGAWDNTTAVLDIPYYDKVQILGFSTASTVEKSAITSWTKLTARTREQAWGAYRRELCLSQRIRYVHSHLLAKIWHKAQVFPAPQGVCTTVDVGSSLVHMARRNILQSLHLYATTQNGTRGLRTIRRSSKMLCPPSQANVRARPKRVVSDGGVASVLGSTKAPREPPCGEDTEDDGVPAHLHAVANNYTFAQTKLTNNEKFYVTLVSNI